MLLPPNLYAMTTFELTLNQQTALKELWHLYGNNGQKANFAQHRFIQAILEQGIYDEGWLSKGSKMKKASKAIAPKLNFNGYLVSDECVLAVNEVLKIGSSNSIG
mgnify:CR=1 FL=1